MSNQKILDRAIKIKLSFPWVVCFLVTYVSSFILSGGSAPVADLDQSYQVVLEYARAHHYQFGRDIVFTFGPLGFLNTWVSQGLFLTERVIFALVWSGIVAWSATGLARQIPGLMKFVFLVWFLVYSNLVWLEPHALMVMAYGCMILMDDIQKRKGAAATFIAVFALLSLIKYNFFIAAVISIILCVLVQIGRRNFRASFAILMCFVSVFIAIWLVEGQELENLYYWVKGSSEIAGGFTDAMTIYPKGKVLVVCVMAGAMYIASLLIIIRSARLSLKCVGVLLATTSYVFLSWKHGFVRADGHVIFFIFFLPLAFAVLLTDNFQKSMNKKLRMYLAALFLGVVILCNWAADFQEPGTMLTKLIYWPGNMMGNSSRILNCMTGDWKNYFEALRENKKLKQESDLPNVRAIVGKASIDVINYRQWAVLANNLNYNPRPVIQSYSAYTPFLQDLNLAFYQSNDKPEYLLFKMETIDNRFPTLDDGLLLPYILQHYTQVGKDGNYLVLRNLPDTDKNIKSELLLEKKISFGEYLELPECKNNLILMQVSINPTYLGRVIKFLFQSPVITLNTETDGNISYYRFIPAMAERGFIINPALRTDDDVEHFYDGLKVGSIDKISFAVSKYGSWQLSKTISVKLFKQSGI